MDEKSSAFTSSQGRAQLKSSKVKEILKTPATVVISIIPVQKSSPLANAQTILGKVPHVPAFACEALGDRFP